MAVARLSHLPVSPRKARIIANMIRGKNATQAINELRFVPKAGAREFFKLLVSALANAEDQGTEALESLVVSSVTVDQGPKRRRFRPRAQGRATRIERKTSHVTLHVEEAKD